MILDLKNVMLSENAELSEEAEIGFSSFDTKLGSYPVTEKTNASLHFANRDREKLLITGRAKLTLLMPCARCLQDTPVTIDLEIEKELPLKTEEGEAEEDEGILNGTELDTDRLIFDELLLNCPMKVLCRDDCKGICPNCGCNLNEKECGCDRTVRDPRMAKFLDFME